MVHAVDVGVEDDIAHSQLFLSGDLAVLDLGVVILDSPSLGAAVVIGDGGHHEVNAQHVLGHAVVVVVDDAQGLAVVAVIKLHAVGVEVLADELAVGDLITYIDGVYHISFPETATESIAKRGIDYKKNTINCGDNTYTWSGIDRLAARYYQEITEVEVETSYTLFLDRYGYVRLATEANKGLALLTDAYYGTDWRNGDYRVETWAMGAEEATDVTVTADKGLSAWTRYADRTLDTDKAYDGFIDTYEERDHGNAGTWDRLHEFGQYRYGTLDQIGTQDDINGHYTGWSNGGNGTDPFRTNVAAYVEKDGEWTLYDVTANNSSRTNYHSYEIYDTGVDGSVSSGRSCRRLQR